MRRLISMVLLSLLLGGAWMSPALGARSRFTTIDIPGRISTEANGSNHAGEMGKRSS